MLTGLIVTIAAIPFTPKVVVRISASLDPGKRLILNYRLRSLPVWRTTIPLDGYQWLRARHDSLSDRSDGVKQILVEAGDANYDTVSLFLTEYSSDEAIASVRSELAKLAEFLDLESRGYSPY